MMILAVMMVMTISARSAMPLGSSKNAMSYNAHPKVFVSYKGGNNRRDVHFYAVRKVTKPVVHHAPAPAPHHPKAPVEVDKRRGITNHTLASNKPRHGHSRSTSGRLLP